MTLHLTVLVLVLTTLVLLRCGAPYGSGPADLEPLVINEFMTSNRTVRFLDEHGEADDWAELFNTGESPFETGGLFLSDDSAKPLAYPLPDTLLSPGGFLLVWLDGSPEQGKWHAPFKLSAQRGEEIVLSRGRRPIDRIRFLPEDDPLARVPDESYGRRTDGSPEWGQQREPSPGSSNRGFRD